MLVGDEAHGLDFGRHALHRLALAEIDDLVDFAPVHGQRHGAVEANVIEDFAQHVVLVRTIERVEHFLAEGRGKRDGVIALGLVFLQKREVLQEHGLLFPDHFAVHDLQVLDFLVADIGLDDFRNVGQLIAGRIHHVEIGVGDQFAAFRGFFHDDVAFQGWHHGTADPGGFLAILQERRWDVLPVRTAVVEVDGFGAIGKAQLLRLLVGIGIVFGHELGKEMPGLERLAVIDGEAVQNARRRHGEGEFDSRRVDGFHICRLAGEQPAVRGLFIDIRIEDHVVVPEHHVFGGERLAVRPFVAFAQGDGQFGVIVVPGPGLGDVRHHGLQVVGVADEIDMANRQQVGGSGFSALGQAGDDAAIGADGVVRRNHKRLGRQTLGHGGEVAIAQNALVEVADIRVFVKAQFAIGARLQFRKLELLGIGRLQAFHVGNGDLGAGGMGCRGHQEEGGTGQDAGAQGRFHRISPGGV